MAEGSAEHPIPKMAQKPSRETSKPMPTPKRPIGVWRWYAPANLVDNDNHLDPPTSLVPKILALLGYKSLEVLNAELNATQRYKIPKPMQKRLSKLFAAQCFSDEEFAFRNIEVEHDGEVIEIPYPCRPVRKPTIKLEIAEFSVAKKPKGKVKLSARISLATNNFLEPRKKSDIDFCNSFLLGSASLSDAQGEAVLIAWLSAAGLSSDAASAAAADDDFRMALSDQILDRIEEFAWAEGASELGDEHAEVAYVLDGEEEKGFST